jgi:hemoglobin
LLDGIGADVLVEAVDLFYDRMLADERVSAYFMGVDLARLRVHQRSFLVAVLGDPGAFNALTVQHAHFPLTISDSDFDITAQHLLDSLLEAGVPASEKKQILRRLERVRTHVVAPSSKAGLPWHLQRRQR